MEWREIISRFWPHLLAGFELVAALCASVHALLNKRDSRAATLWLVTIWFLPVLGPVLYLVLGVNRIRRRAAILGMGGVTSNPTALKPAESEPPGVEPMQKLARMVDGVSARPLTVGNRFHPLVNGDEAFPEMLAAIDSAKISVLLTSYIFDNDKSGGQFVAALQRAVERGVQTRVLVDAAGTRYSWPPITLPLRRAGVPHAKFLPTPLFAPWRVATVNMRSHRKLLAIDGHTAFTGGMNIRQGNVLADHPKNPVRDLHFRVTGPVVAQLQEAFAKDWSFTTGENLSGETWFPTLGEDGNVVARAITDGPDEDYDKLRWTLLSALAEAHHSVRIVTPYFLPDSALVTALNLAALRDVRVEIILPSKSNLPYVHWASQAMWWQVLEHGCQIWLTEPPFDHSKLMIVDDRWVFLGSANWDPRSLRLNFELNVEAYGLEFAQTMNGVIDKKLQGAKEVTLADVDARGYPSKLRDAVARLFSPYL